MRGKQLTLVGVTVWSLGLTVWGMQAPAPQAPATPAPPPAGRGAAPAAGSDPAAPTDPAAPFYAHVVATGLRGGYQVVATDMNKDGKVDLIGLGSNMTDLIWYENPYWTPHVITRERAAHDQSGGDGHRSATASPRSALAYEFGTTRRAASARWRS